MFTFLKQWVIIKHMVQVISVDFYGSPSNTDFWFVGLCHSETLLVKLQSVRRSHCNLEDKRITGCWNIYGPLAL